MVDNDGIAARATKTFAPLSAIEGRTALANVLTQLEANDTRQQAYADDVSDDDHEIALSTP